MKIEYKFIDEALSSSRFDAEVLHVHTFESEEEAAEFLQYWFRHPDKNGFTYDESLQECLLDIKEDIATNSTYYYEGAFDVMILNSWLKTKHDKKMLDKIDAHVQE